MSRSFPLLFLLIAFGMAAPAPAAAGAAGAKIDQRAWTAMKQKVQLPNGVRLAYVELGNPKGPPLLLLHGWTDTSRSWTILAPQLARYRVLIPDLRGHGNSDAPDCCYSLSSFAHDARLFLDAMKVKRASVAGHSLGSMVAQLFAAENPDRVDRLVLVASTALAPVERGDWLWNNVSRLNFPLGAESEFIKTWSALSSPTPLDPDFVAHAVPETIGISAHVWRGVLRELAGIPIGRYAADISAPTLILAGGRDELFGADHQQALRKALPHASFRGFPELGHNLLWERPDEVGAVLTAFLASSEKVEGVAGARNDRKQFYTRAAGLGISD
jgi:pimeloyl-ACP methyl ester carboxylesterase